MRAKEYLEINKSKILYYDIVKSAIDALSLLRNSKRKTREYFNRYLFADARQMSQKEDFVLREGEVDFEDVKHVRFEIMNAVFNDESFIFAYNIIVMQKNDYHKLLQLNCCKIKEINSETISNIERICSMYKEDYPKQHLCDYLIDEENEEYARSKHCLQNGSIEWWNDVFNKAYEQFDIIRIKLMNGFDEQSFVESICTGDKKMNHEVIELVSYMLKNYSYDLDEIQIRRYRLLSESLKITYSLKQSESNMLAEPMTARENNKERNEESEIDKLKIEIDRLKSENERLKDANVMTCSQQVMAFIYLLNLIGINTENTKKSIIARFVHRITGRSEDNIRKRLEFDYDDVNVKQNLRIVAEAFSEILPSTTEQILKDIDG